MTAFVPPPMACTPTATFESAVPRGEGDTWRSFGEVPFSDDSEDADVDVEYVFGVDGCNGCEGKGDDDFDDGTESDGDFAAVLVPEPSVGGETIGVGDRGAS